MTVQRIAFRFCFLYLGLFCIVSQPIDGFLPLVDANPLCALPPLSTVISWTAVHVFSIRSPLVFFDSGSGDKTSDWICLFLILMVAIVGTAIWSFLDRKRTNDDGLAKWFALFVRFSLASQLLGYGFAKLVPEQMGYPRLTTLLEPYGNFSPMGVLWSSIGAAPAYESFAGAAEIFGGLLLIFPRTAMLGALVSAADMTQVFTLNMTYDVSVKLLSFHLLLLSVYLLAPEAQRLFDFFVRNRIVSPSARLHLFRAARANRIALVAQVLLGVYLAAANIWSTLSAWNTYGDGSPKSALYGIWNVDVLAIDGRVRLPLVTDRERFRRIIFDRPGRVAFQRMDDTFQSYQATIATEKKSMLLSDAKDATWRARYTFVRHGTSGLSLDGVAGTHRVRMQLALVDRNSFLLVSRGFHWVQDYPFHR